MTISTTAHNFHYNRSDLAYSIMEEADVVVLLLAKVESEKPPADGDLTVSVHVVSVNHLNTSFSKTKKSISFVVRDAGKFLDNFDKDDYRRNLSVAQIHVENLHSLVIRHFGAQAKNVIERIQSGNEPRLQNSIQNTTTPDYSVRLLLWS